MISNSQSTLALTGTIFDSNGAGVPNAKVSLYQDGKIFSSPENPQLTGNGQAVATGQYSFARLPPGNYTIIAESGSYKISKNITLSIPGTNELDLTIPNYVYHSGGGTSTGTPTSDVAPTGTPTATSKVCLTSLVMPLMVIGIVALGTSRARNGKK